MYSTLQLTTFLNVIASFLQSDGKFNELSGTARGSNYSFNLSRVNFALLGVAIKNILLPS